MAYAGGSSPLGRQLASLSPRECLPKRAESLINGTAHGPFNPLTRKFNKFSQIGCVHGAGAMTFDGRTELEACKDEAAVALTVSAIPKDYWRL